MRLFKFKILKFLFFFLLIFVCYFFYSLHHSNGFDENEFESKADLPRIIDKYKINKDDYKDWHNYMQIEADLAKKGFKNNLGISLLCC